MSRFGFFGDCETADACTMDPACELFRDCELHPVAGTDEEEEEEP